MRAFVIFATVLAVAIAAPQGYDQFGGSVGTFAVTGGSTGGFGGSTGGFGGSTGGSVRVSGSDEIQRGDTQIIDLSDAFGAGGNGRSDAGAAAGGNVEYSKAFYLHESPEDESRADAGPVETKTKKHYKIIFVKAPSDAGAGAGAQSRTQHEEKTIVYVLSKKGGAAGGELQDAPEPVNHKPDVFFVKYKNAADSEQVVQKIQESFKEGGEGFNSPDSFSRSLGATGGSASQSSFTATAGGYAEEYERRRKLRYRQKKY